ncbi:MAG: hypothetical protein H7Z11_10760 [Verrucomicrobia bacterium]|nr:hypothetical protein [Leptolyngbya sp. ES-bin-22]
MALSSRIAFTVGIAFTAMGLVIGCFAARVSTFTCIRDQTEQQGICRLEQSTLFLPWNKKVVSFPLDDIQKAESVELGVDLYAVVLRSRSNAPNPSLYTSEYAENSHQLASQINSFLDNPKTNVLKMQEGGGFQETVILLGFCSFGLLLIWQSIEFWHHPDSNINLDSK